MHQRTIVSTTDDLSTSATDGLSTLATDGLSTSATDDSSTLTAGYGQAFFTSLKCCCLSWLYLPPWIHSASSSPAFCPSKNALCKNPYTNPRFNIISDSGVNKKEAHTKYFSEQCSPVNHSLSSTVALTLAWCSQKKLAGQLE